MSCVRVQYRDFSERIRDKLMSTHCPAVIELEVTMRCNLGCRHCLIVRSPHKKEMNTRQICRIIDEAADEGTLWLLLTGGEIFLRKDFPQIYLHAKKRGMIVTLFTNGTLLTPVIADFLQDYPPLKIDVSLYGITKETYESVTRFKGSFERCMEGIRLLRERNIVFRIKTVLMTLNKHELWGMIKFARSMGTPHMRFDPMINPGLDGSKIPCSFRLKPEEVVQYDMTDKGRRRSLRELREKYQEYTKARLTDDLYSCYGGIESCHIDAYGNLSMCVLARSETYNLLRGSLREGYRVFLPAVRAKKLTADFPCRTCELYGFCHQCPEWARLENGNPEMPVDFLCKISYLRKERLERLFPRDKVLTPSRR